MLKNISNLKGAKVLTKESQSNITGGMISNRSCPTGCFSFFLSSFNQDFCAVAGSSGEVCFGTIRAGKCCL